MEDQGEAWRDKEVCGWDNMSSIYATKVSIEGHYRCICGYVHSYVCVTVWLSFFCIHAGSEGAGKRQCVWWCTSSIIRAASS